MPTWRRDVAIEADVAEEIARVRGYELVPSVTPDTAMPAFRPSPLEVRELVRDTLAGAGLTEVVTTALVSPRHVEVVRPARARCRPSATSRSPAARRSRVDQPALARPLDRCAGTCSAACSTWSGRNLRHGIEDVAVFEIGKGYARTGDEPREWWRLGFALVGSAEPPAWNRPARPYDLDDAKGLLELVADRLDLGRPAYRAESGEAVFHPGRTARADDRGTASTPSSGELHPSTRRRLGAADRRRR